MLKRYQVLLNDWLANGIKDIAKKYDISFSEVLRVALCIQVTESLARVNPKFKSKKTEKFVDDIIKKRNKGENLDSETLHKFFSDVYFEARKSIEAWKEEETKQKKTK